MAHTYHELKEMTVAQMREVAKEIEHEAVKGATQMNKEHLLKALCTALNIEMHEHHEVVGIDKSAVKLKIRELRKKRDEILASKDLKDLHGVLRQIHALKRTLRRATI